MQSPDNASYMYAAYAVVGIVYFGYVIILIRRDRKLKQRLRRTDHA